MHSAAPLRQFAMPLPALPVLAGLVAKAAGQMAVKWAPYYAAKYGVYVAMKEYGVGRTYRRLIEANRIVMEDPVDRKHVQGVIRIVFRLPTKINAALEDTTVVTFLRRYQAYLSGAFTVHPSSHGPASHEASGGGERAGAEAAAGGTTAPPHGGTGAAAAAAAGPDASSAPAAARSVVWGSGLLRGLPLHVHREAKADPVHPHGSDAATATKAATPGHHDSCASSTQPWVVRQYADVVVPEFLILAVNALVSTLPAGKL